MATDVSGLAWLRTDTVGEVQREVFLVVHDGKNKAEEAQLPRVSILKTPVDEGGVDWLAFAGLTFPTRGVSNDLESVARIPGRDLAILVESGNGGDRPGAASHDADAGLYLAAFEGDALEIRAYTPWPKTPEPVHNVEASAVSLVGDQFFFLYAERASGRDTTEIHWTTLDIRETGELQFGSAWQSVPFTSPGPPGARPVTAMEVGADGAVYIASAFDPDDDNGPFESSVWLMGHWARDGAPGIAPLAAPVAVGHFNGLKVEGIAVAGDAGAGRLFIGTDDENYPAVLRPLRPHQPD